MATSTFRHFSSREVQIVKSEIFYLLTRILHSRELIFDIEKRLDPRNNPTSATEASLAPPISMRANTNTSSLTSQTPRSDGHHVQTPLMAL